MSAIKPKSGFIALISVIILGSVLLVSVIALSSRSISNRFSQLDLERKNSTEQLADACVQVAIISIVNDAAYNVSNRSIFVGSETCTIVSVTPSGGQSTIKTRATFSGATTNIELVWNIAGENISSRRECKSFNPACVI